MSDPTTEAGADTIAAQNTEQASAELNAISGWLRQAGETGLDLSLLLGLELRLAAGDLGRMIVLTLLLLPVLLLAWTGLCICLSWLAYLLSGQPIVAFIAFPLLQAAVALFICQRYRQYSKSLSLPRVRQHLHAMINGQEDESRATDL